MNIKEFILKRRVGLGFLFALVYIIFSIPSSSTSMLIGFIIAVLGELIRVISSGFIIKTDELTTTGPYAYVRHPLYLGSFVMGLGCCIAVFSMDYILLSLIILILYLLFFFSVYIPLLKKEEIVLTEKYKDAYLTYMKNVPMFLPRLTPYTKGGSNFSIKIFMKNKEYQAIIGLLIIILITIIKYELYFNPLI
jgi:protein-S-isoprenylcysteine O-methyltransferase Ste14